jgi:hypothetical protein
MTNHYRYGLVMLMAPILVSSEKAEQMSKTEKQAS